MKKFVLLLLLVLTGKSDKAVDAGICNYSGQGRDAYGK